MLPILGTILGGIGGKILKSFTDKAGDVVDQMVEDKDLAIRIKSEIFMQVSQLDLTKFVAQLEAQKSVLVAELQGESWSQRNWRPIVMLMFATIIANNYIVFPYLSAFGIPVVQLEPPPQMWNMIGLGLSGYVVGRSAEKIAKGTGIKGALDKVLNGGDKS
jgi:hypothetical protein